MLPFCIINAILGAAIGILKDEYDVGASIQIQEHITLSRMIAFLVVTRVRKAYDDVALSIGAIGMTLLRLGETFKAVNKFSWR